jgi:hypothetical protein
VWNTSSIHAGLAIVTATIKLAKPAAVSSATTNLRLIVRPFRIHGKLID